MHDENSNYSFDEREEDARVSRLSTFVSGSDQAEPPPFMDDGDTVVREYESRYQVPRKRKPLQDRPRSYSTMHVSKEERLWVAIAHASVWITFITGFMTVGIGVTFSIFIPLGIYLIFRKKSDYVAFHALQAFVLQLLGTVGALAIITVGGIVWGLGLVVSLFLMIVLVGFILVPVWGLLGLVFFVLAMALPFIMLFFGTVGAVRTYNGQDYRYPRIARWVDRQMAGGFLNV
jgi:uncharacterized Tic20 family protein